MKYIPLLAICLGLISCANYQVPDSQSFPSNSKWAIMPLVNNSNTPLAAEKVEQILSAQLYAKGIDVIVYPAFESTDLASILDNSAKYRRAQDWLASQAVDYIILGSVEEWHYKSGLDGEPAVGISLQVANKAQQTLWRATGTRGGWGRESVSGTGHIVIAELLDGIKVAQN